MKMDYLTIELDDETRAHEGVVATLRNVTGGKSRLTFDDVFVDSVQGNSRTWKHRTFYTHAEFDDAKLEEMALSDEDYQKIGEALVARLLVINGRVE